MQADALRQFPDTDDTERQTRSKIPYKETNFHYDTHKCIFNLGAFGQRRAAGFDYFRVSL
jgi:hypothetical protein